MKMTILQKLLPITGKDDFAVQAGEGDNHVHGDLNREI